MNRNFYYVVLLSACNGCHEMKAPDMSGAPYAYVASPILTFDASAGFAPVAPTNTQFLQGVADFDSVERRLARQLWDALQAGSLERARLVAQDILSVYADGEDVIVPAGAFVRCVLPLAKELVEHSDQDDLMYWRDRLIRAAQLLCIKTKDVLPR